MILVKYGISAHGLVFHGTQGHTLRREGLARRRVIEDDYARSHKHDQVYEESTMPIGAEKNLHPS